MHNTFLFQTLFAVPFHALALNKKSKNLVLNVKPEKAQKVQWKGGIWPLGGNSDIATAVFIFRQNVWGLFSFEVWSKLVSAGQSNYRAAWSERPERSEESACSSLRLLPASTWSCSRGYSWYWKHLYVSPWHHVKGNIVNWHINRYLKSGIYIYQCILHYTLRI